MNCDAGIEAACCELMAEVVRGAGWARLRVTGFSMLPAIWPGDVLTLRRHSGDLVRAGQIVVTLGDGRLTAHRVIFAPGGAGERVITRGDSVPSADPAVAAGEILGEVVGICRRGRAVRVESRGWQRGVAWALRRSEVCTRLLMYWSGLERRLRGAGDLLARRSDGDISC